MKWSAFVLPILLCSGCATFGPPAPHSKIVSDDFDNNSELILAMNGGKRFHSGIEVPAGHNEMRIIASQKHGDYSFDGCVVEWDAVEGHQYTVRAHSLANPDRSKWEISKLVVHDEYRSPTVTEESVRLPDVTGKPRDAVTQPWTAALYEAERVVAPCVFPQVSKSTIRPFSSTLKSFVPQSVIRKFVPVEVPSYLRGSTFAWIKEPVSNKDAFYIRYPDGFGGLYIEDSHSDQTIRFVGSFFMGELGTPYISVEKKPNGNAVGAMYKPEDIKSSANPWSHKLEEFNPTIKPIIILKAEDEK